MPTTTKGGKVGRGINYDIRQQYIHCQSTYGYSQIRIHLVPSQGALSPLQLLYYYQPTDISIHKLLASPVIA